MIRLMSTCQIWAPAMLVAIIGLFSPLAVAQPDPSFSQPYTFGVGGKLPGRCYPDPRQPWGVAIGDLMGTGQDSPPDCWPEVVVVNHYEGSLSVFRNMQTWSNPYLGLELAYPPLELVLPAGCGSLKLTRVVLADLDRDFDLDIIVTLFSATAVYPGGIFVLWNEGNGQFDAEDAKFLALGTSGDEGWGIAVHDFDEVNQGSGALLPDIAVSARRLGYPALYLFHQTSPRQFSIELIGVRTDLPGSAATDVVAVRLRSGIPMTRRDLVLSVENEPAIWPVFNEFGILQSQPPQTSVAGSFSLSAGRFRGGAMRDIAIASALTRNGYLHKNVGNGTISLNPAGVSATNNALADCFADVLNSDSYADLAVACPYFEVGEPYGGVAVLVGKGGGIGSTPGFRTGAVRYTIEDEDAYPLVVKTGDLNHDSKNDMVVSLHGADQIAVFLGQQVNLLAPCGTEGFSGIGEEDGYYGEPEKE